MFSSKVIAELVLLISVICISLSISFTRSVFVFVLLHMPGTDNYWVVIAYCVVSGSLFSSSVRL